MACADGDGQRINACASHEVDYLLGVGVGVVVGGNLVLYSGQYAQLALDGNIILVCVVAYLLGQGYVLLIGKVAAVDHDA